MTEFKDSSSRIWNLSITLGSAKRVYERTGINLLDPSSLIAYDTDGKPNPFASRSRQMISDSLLIGDMVASLVEKQARERGIYDYDELLEVFDASTLKNAHDAFLKEYHAFFTVQKSLAGQEIVENIQKIRAEIESGENGEALPGEKSAD